MSLRRAMARRSSSLTTVIDGWTMLAKKLLLGFALAFALVGMADAAATADETTGERRSRLLGDKAFEDGLYDVAEGYYLRYQDEAGADGVAARDAAFCLLATYLRSGEVEKARQTYKKLLAEHKEYFNDSKPGARRLLFWKGGIYFAEADYAKAAEAYSAAMDAAADSPQDTLRGLEGLGNVYLKRKEWAKAAAAFSQVAAGDAPERMKSEALEKLVVAAMMGGDMVKARQAADSLAAKDGKKVRAELLKVFSLAVRGELDQACEAFMRLKEKASGPDPLWHATATVLAEARLRNKNYPEALALFSDCLKLAPSAHERERALADMVEVSVVMGDTGAAERFATELLDKSSGSPFCSKALAAAVGFLVDSGRADSAVPLASKYLRDANASSEDKLALASAAGLAMVKAKRYGDAESFFTYVAKNAPGDAEKGDGELWLANVAFMRGDYRKGGEDFKRVGEVYPELKEKAAFREAQCLWQLQDYTRAEGVLAAFLRQYPESSFAPDAVFLHSLALRKCGKADEAAKELERFIKLFPDNDKVARVWFEIGGVAMDAKAYPEAIKAFSETVRLGPRGPQAANALYRLVYARYLSGDYDGASRDAKTLAAQFPATDFAVSAGFWVADHLWNQGDYQASLDQLQAMAKTYSATPDVAAEALYNAAEAMAKLKRDGEAMPLLDRVIAEFPKEKVSSKAFYLKGDLLKAAGDYKNAISFYAKAAERRPGSPLELASLGSLGDSCFALAGKDKQPGDNLAQATASYAKILADRKRLDQATLDQTLFKLGKCHELAGRRDDAIKCYHEVVFNTVIDEERGAKRDLLWFAKAGESLARLMGENMDTPERAEAVLSVYRTLAKHGVHPDEYNQLIDKIRNANKL